MHYVHTSLKGKISIAITVFISGCSFLPYSVVMYVVFLNCNTKELSDHLGTSFSLCLSVSVTHTRTHTHTPYPHPTPSVVNTYTLYQSNNTLSPYLFQSWYGVNIENIFHLVRCLWKDTQNLIPENKSKKTVAIFLT